MFFKEFLYKAQTQTFTSNKLFTWGLGTSGQLGSYGESNLSLVQASAGQSHVLAITSDSRLLSWGVNSDGQLGDGTTINKSNPVQVGQPGWKKVAAGLLHSVAIRSDGTLFSWGSNSVGQLGLNLGTAATARRSNPTQIGSLANWIDISGKATTTIALNEARELYAWGNNNLGQIGVNDTINRSSPVQIGIGLSWYKVSVGSHVMGVTVTGELYGWGANGAGQLGINATNNRSSPTLVANSGYTDVSIGEGHTLGLASGNLLFAWGNNLEGQLGDGTTILKSSPVQIGSSSFTFISAASRFSQAIRLDGGLFAWGLNTSGQIGTNNQIGRSSPVQVGTSSWSLVASSLVSGWVIGTTSDKTAYGWGANGSGQLGNNTTITRSSPTLVASSIVGNYSVPIQVGTLSWNAISTGGTHTIALRSDNLLFAWGLNTSGQLGDNTAISKSSPVQIGTSSWTAVTAGEADSSFAIRSDNTLWTWGNVTTNLTGGNILTESWQQVTNNANSSIGLRADGTLWTWGENSFGQIGNNTTINRSSPVQIASDKSWLKLGENNNVNNAVAAIDSNYKLWVWGRNNTGQLATGDTINRSSPVLVMSDKSWSMVSASKGITTDGKLWSWGAGATGLIGDNTTVDKSSPVQLSVGTSFTLVSGASDSNRHTFAISTTGLLYGWGFNNTGQLGLGNTLNRSQPTLLASPFDTFSWNFVSVGGTDGTGSTGGHTLALRNDNTLYVWGLNNVGQLGNNTTINRSSPLQVSFVNIPLSWATVAAAASRSTALDFDGKLWGWGINTTYGAVGDSTTVNRSSPVILTSTGVTFAKITSGYFHSNGIRDDGYLYAWGANNLGNLGNNTTINRSSPALISSIPTNLSSPVQLGVGKSNWSAIHSGTSTHAAIDATGALYIWGSNATGQLGNNSVFTRTGLRVLDNNSWNSVSVGASHVLAIRNNNQLYAWGGNASFQIGDNSSINKSSPILIDSASWLSVSAGINHSLAIKSGGGLYAWGSGLFGQTGIITDIYSWTQINAGTNFVLGVRQDSTLWGYGLNTSGQLGDSTAATKSSPTQVGTTSWSKISAGGSNALGITIDGKLFSWGSGSTFQLGDGTTINKSSPVQIGTSSWSQITTGTAHSLAIDINGRLFGWGTSTALNASTAPFSWTVVSENTSHVAAVRSDGLLFVWGLNSSGQVGDNTTINKSSPVQIGTSSWLTVSSGVDHTLAITSDYRLFAWGGNTGFQLGDNTTISKSSPVLLSGPSWTTVVAANSYSMALKSNNTLWAWGLGTSGQLGTLTEPKSWIELSAGNSTSLAIRSDNTLWGWGLNTSFQIGNGASVTQSSPVQVDSSLSWIKVSSGNNHGLAITNTGVLYGWGTNAQGQVGNNTSVNRSLPTLVDSSGSWSVVSAGNSFSLGIKENKLYTWGQNSLGQLGQGDTITRLSPTQVGLNNWTVITSSETNNYAGAIDSSNRLFLWGVNTNYQLGDGTTTNRNSPVAVFATGTSSYVQVSVGASHTLAVQSDGTLWAWGSNTNYILGLGDTNIRSIPTQMGSSSWTSVSAGTDHSMAIKSDGTLWGWGFNLFGQVGLATTVYSWTQVANTGLTTHAIRSDGLLFGWGLNTSGEIGDNSIINKSSPVQVGIKTWKKVYNFTALVGNLASVLAIDNNDNLFAWGNNTSGNLGDNTVISRSSPVAVVIKGTGSYTQVFVGPATVAIQNDGTLWSWGAGSFVGDNTTISRSSPVQIGSSTWSAVGGALSTIAAIDATGRLFTWGNQSASGSGSLGTNDLINRSSPTLVAGAPGAFSWTSVSSGGANHVLAIRENGAAYGTGLNAQGQLGDNTATSKSTFTLVSGTTSFTQVRCGFSFTIASASDGTLWGWGNNDWGQLTTTLPIAANRSNPVQIVAPGPTVYSTGQYNLATIYSNGLLYNQGYNLNGMLGDGTTTSKSLPVQIGNNPIINISVPVQIGTGSWNQVNAGTQYTLARDTNNVLYAWGQDTSGQLGF